MARRIGDAEPPARTVGRDHFDALYAQHEDPWHFATSWYERRKFAVTLASLPRERYEDGYEAGCSIGELTKLLAPRCERLLAVDFSADAVRRATAATRAFGHVQVAQAELPRELPDKRFNLVVLSELLYYFSGPDLDALLDGVVERVVVGGDVVVVHCQTAGSEHAYDGFNVNASVVARAELRPLVHHEDEAFVLDALRRR